MRKRAANPGQKDGALLTDDLASRSLDLSLATARPVREIEIDLGSADTVRIPDAHLMFQGEYRKDGFDLVIEDGQTRVTLNDYFRAAKRPALESPDGARLTEDVVAALAVSDHGQRYAQATPPAQPAAIGRVETVTGQATVIRNGTPVVLNQGDLVLKGDVVQTDRGSSLGITFIDGSTFSLGSGARMVLNDMVYQAGGTQNSALINIVQGSVTFLAGQVAKTGEMRVGTPVATMGIRGTLVNAEINADNGQVRFSVIREPNGEVGRYDLIRDGRVVATVSAVDQVTIVSPTGVVTSEPKSFQQQQAEELLVQQVFQIFSLGQANPLLPGTGPTGPGPGGGGGGGGGSSTDPNLNGSTSPNGGAGAGTGGVPSPGGPPVPPPDFQPPNQPNQNPTGGPPPVVVAGGGSTALPAKAVSLGPDEGVAGLRQELLGPSAGIPGLRVVAVRAPDGHVVAVAQGGEATVVDTQYGLFEIRPDGSYRYTALDAAPLAAGEHGVESFEIILQDANGQSYTLTFTFDVTGENDAPVIGDALSVVVNEGPGTASIDLLTGASDVDNGAALHIENLRLSGSETGDLPPGISLSADGRTLLIDSDHPAYDDLGAGQTRTFTFVYDVVDEYGARVSQSATIVVNGADEPPPAFDGSFETGFTGWNQAGDTAVVPGGTTGSQAARITTSSDLSLTYAEIESFLGVPSGSLAQDASANHPNNNSTIGSAIRTIAIRLEAGQSFRFDWNFSTTDYNPFNDFAVFTVDELNAIFELADVENVGDGGSTGWRTFTFTAREAGEYHFGFAVLDTGDGSVESTLLIDNVRVESAGAPVLTGPVAGAATEDSGTAAIDLLAGASDPGGSALHIEGLDWHNSPGTGLPPGFSLAPDGHTIVVDTSNAAFQSLGQGQSRVFDFDYEVVDASGAKTTQSARITVTGTNDGPVAQANTSSVSAGSSATASTRSAGVLGNDTDPDSAETAALVVNGIKAGTSSTAPFSGVSAGGTALTGQYGTLTINPNGTYTYSAHNAQGLNQGDTATDTFTYQTVDPHGAVSTATLTFTVTGVNDAPTVSASAPSATLVESGLDSSGDPVAGTDSSSVTMSASDPDANDSVSFVRPAGATDYAYYSYVSAPGITWAAARAAALAAGGYLANITSAAENAAVQAAKGSGTFAWIGGTDDGVEGNWRWADGPEAGQVFSIGSTVQSGYYAGWWGSEPNGGTSENYVYIDGNAAWTDAAGNNLPSPGGYVIEFSGWQIQGAYGSAAFNPATGVLTYTLDDGRAATQALAAGTTTTDEFDIQVTDSHGAVTTQHVVFTVQGTNDAPELFTEGAHLSGGPYVLNRPNVSEGILLGDLTTGTKNLAGATAATVEFRMNWSGAELSMPFGFNIFDVAVAHDTAGQAFIAINTGAADYYGAYYPGLENAWHDVKVVFVAGDVAASRIFIDGQELTLTQLVGAPYNPNAIFSGNARIGGWGVSEDPTFDGMLDDVRVWRGDFTDPGFDPVTALVAEYTFDQVTNGPGGVSDSSGGNHGGTLHGGLTASDILRISGSLSEDAGSSATGAIRYTDPDAGTALSASVDTANPAINYVPADGASALSAAEIAALKSAFSYVATGEQLTWSYAAAGLDFLAADDVVTLTYAAIVDDGTMQVSQPITVTVGGLNDAPNAVNDNPAAFFGGFGSGSVLANDTDDKGAELTITGIKVGTGTGSFTQVNSSGTITINGANGDLTIDASGSYSYAANPSATGFEDDFRYLVRDEHGLTGEAVLHVEFFYS
jgi:VCBS repeat-containing protein